MNKFISCKIIIRNFLIFLPFDWKIIKENTLSLEICVMLQHLRKSFNLHTENLIDS